MIPARYAPLVFGLLLSGCMSLIVSGMATARALGLDAGFLGHWMQSWLPSWGIAFPTVMVVAPVVRRIVARLTAA